MELLPEHELQGRERQVSVEGRLVAVEEGDSAFGLDDGAAGVDGAAVVVAGFEGRVVVTTLELESGFEDFGGDVNDGGGKVAEEACCGC